MKALTIRYERKDFFSKFVYTEDTKADFTKADLIKAFLYMSKEWKTTILIDDSMCIYWYGLSDFENRTVTVRIYDENGNYTEGKMPFEELKKNFYLKFKKAVVAA